MIKYDPRYTCDFCGSSGVAMLTGIGGTSCICRDCARVVAEDPTLDPEHPASTPSKHPRAIEYERAQYNHGLQNANVAGQAQGINIHGIGVGNSL